MIIDKSDEIRLQVVLQRAVESYVKKYATTLDEACKDLNVRYEFYIKVREANDKHDAVSNLNNNK